MYKTIIAATACLLTASAAFAQSETAPRDVVPLQTIATKQGPKIHLVAVVDASGCKNLNGGLMSGAGTFVGGLLAHKAKSGMVGSALAGEAGKQIGNMHDKAQRCRQEINVDKAVMAGS